MKKKTIDTAIQIHNENHQSLNGIERLSKSPMQLQNYLDDSERNSFRKLLFELTHKNYSEALAEELWHAIRIHRNHISQLLGRDVGTLVAALDYLHNIKNAFIEPTIIEREVIRKTASFATTDLLTGLFTRDVFDILFEKEITKCLRNKKKLALILIDVDDFKRINDTFGHNEGDQVLRKLGQVLLNGLREYDIAARYGGEEFAIVLPDTSPETAFTLAERLRSNIAKSLKSDDYDITVSVGIAMKSMETLPTDIIIKADKALYEAKENGKNRTILYDS